MPAADFLQEDSDGFLKEDANGFLLEGNEGGGCCCGCPCDECAGSSAPCTATVTSDSIDYQACDGVCINGISFGLYNPSHAPGDPACSTLTLPFEAAYASPSTVDPNGVFPLAIVLASVIAANCYDSAYCEWGARGTSITSGGFTSGSGTGPDADAMFAGLSNCTLGQIVQPYWGWVLRKTAAKWYLAFMCLCSTVQISGVTEWVALYKFYGELDATDDCSSTLTFTNQLVAGSVVSGCAPFSGVFDDYFSLTCIHCPSAVASHGVSLGTGGEAVVTFS